MVLEIGDAFIDGIGRDLVSELALFDRCKRAPVRLGGELVLGLAADFPLVRHLFRGDAHAVGDADVFVLEKDLLVGGDLVAAHRNHAHALGAGADHDFGFAEADAVRRNRHRLEPRRTEAIDGHSRNVVGKSGEQQPDAGDVHPLLGLRHRAADHDVVYHRGIQSRRLRECTLQHMRQHVVWTDVPEHAARRLAHRRARRTDDVCIMYLLSHFDSSKSESHHRGTEKIEN